MSIFFKTFIFWAFTLSIFAQQNSTDYALNKACNCLGSTKLDSLTIEKLEFLGDSCITLALWQNMTGLMDELNVDGRDKKAWEKTGIKLGKKLAESCWHYQVYARQLAMERFAGGNILQEQQQGLLLSLNRLNCKASFTLLDSLGQKHEFLWLHEFDGSARFFDGISPYRFTEVEIVWQETELFDPESKKYINYREIILLEEKGTITEESCKIKYPLAVPPSKKKKKEKKR